MQIQTWQIGKIKQLKKARGMSDAAYYDALAEWGVDSCTKLSFVKANNLIAMWRQLAIAEGRISGNPKKCIKFDHLENRSSRWPSTGQLRLLDSLWSHVSTAPAAERDEAFNNFLFRRFHIADISQLPKDMVQKVKKVLDEMKEQQHGKATRKKAGFDRESAVGQKSRSVG